MFLYEINIYSSWSDTKQQPLGDTRVTATRIILRLLWYGWTAVKPDTDLYQDSDKIYRLW